MAASYGDEYILGYCPSRTGKDYDAQYVGPTWDALLTLLAREGIHTFAILFCGITGSPDDEKPGSTGFAVTTRGAVQRVAIDMWDINTEPHLTTITRNPANTPILAYNLLGLNLMPKHITGIVIRVID